MAQMSAEDIDSVRKEVREVLDQEGGWNKAALNRFWKIDSILREVGRMHALAFRESLSPLIRSTSNTFTFL